MVLSRQKGDMKMRVFTLMKRQANGRQRGITLIAMLLLLIVIGIMFLIAMQVVPMYIQYYSIKSTVESVRKEPVAQMEKEQIWKALQKRFDTGYVDTIKAQDLKIRNERSGKVLDLVYNDERELVSGLFVVLKVNEVVPLQ